MGDDASMIACLRALYSAFVAIVLVLSNKALSFFLHEIDEGLSMNNQSLIQLCTMPAMLRNV